MKNNKILTKIKPYLGTFQSLDDDTEFDYFITFKTDNEIPLKILNEIGHWSHYGEKTIRGWSSVSKEDITLFIMNNLKLKEDEFEVLNANNDLFRIRF